MTNGSFALRFRTSTAVSFLYFLRLLDGEEKLELWRKLLLRIQAIGEVDAPDAAVRMDLHAKRFNVVGACESCKEDHGQFQH